jgi:hypothetical protein
VRKVLATWNPRPALAPVIIAVFPTPAGYPIILIEGINDKHQGLLSIALTQDLELDNRDLTRFGAMLIEDPVLIL